MPDTEARAWLVAGQNWQAIAAQTMAICAPGDPRWVRCAQQQRAGYRIIEAAMRGDVTAAKAAVAAYHA